MSLDDVNSLSERTFWLALKTLGGPLPRAQRPRSGRALSRDQRRPRDQAAFGVSAHSRNDPSRDLAVRSHCQTDPTLLCSGADQRLLGIASELLGLFTVEGIRNVSRWGPPRTSAACHRRPAISFSLHLGGHPRRQWCDGAAAVALEATRLRRVLHCVAALRDASVAWVPQAPGPPRSRARRRGNRPPPELRS
jgi:hypothetical protein